MKKRRWSDRWLPLGLVLLSLHGAAQDSFHYRAPLDTIKSDAFYWVLLPPSLVAKSRPDLGDLRILGPDNRFVPYVLKDIPRALLNIPEVAPEQKDSSDKHSYITLRFTEAYEIDRVVLVINSPQYYKRSAYITAESPVPGQWEPVTRIMIDPAHILFHIPSTKTHCLHIDIANEDNPPLVISRIACSQICRYMVSYLTAGEGYFVLTGNPAAAVPDYDLKYFTDSLIGEMHYLTPGPLQYLTGKGQPASQAAARTVNKKTAAAERQSGVLLWVILSTVLIFLIYFSVKMVGAIGTKKSPHDRI
ncbi:MAG TPA: hypothetical protein VGQ51_01480 [Puia sp.]|jgi:hypothetical protein|nr:hypothetical protein [Puia sp.]